MHFYAMGSFGTLVGPRHRPTGLPRSADPLMWPGTRQTASGAVRPLSGSVPYQHPCESRLRPETGSLIIIGTGVAPGGGREPY
ncbi:hypothetical protein GCM10009716_01510 [Streptomyces sodiiphilus]|uniref:Uncharacterized protein n=1 Tax=Streptomyces sodiiphilus TaxID=226217 RepID=A0ABN2NTM1_9ACTN